MRRQPEAHAGRRLTEDAVLPTKLQLPTAACVLSCRLTAPPSCTISVSDGLLCSKRGGAKGELTSAELASKAQLLIAPRAVLSAAVSAPPRFC